jgi:hypothetical protein
MRTSIAVLVLTAATGVATAQPGGSDLQPGFVESQQGEPPPQQQQVQQGPQLPDPATAPTRATFVSTSETPWDVWVDRTAICATPCTLGLSGVNFVSLKSQERQPIRLDIGYLQQGDVIVSGTPMREGMYAGGIVATTFGGMALATGITLAAVGWGTDRNGMRTAGLITGVAGAVGVYAGIQLMRAALPRFLVGPASPYAAPNQVGLAGSF